MQKRRIQNMKLKDMPQAITWFLIMVFIIILIPSCVRKVTENQEKVKESQEQILFVADSAMAFVSAQLEFGPRVPGSSAHEKCAQYLYSTLEKYAHKVEQQKFTDKRWDGQRMDGINIIASFYPEKKERVLLAAHWDSRPYADQEEDPANRSKAIDGANDGASGVGVLLEIARVLYQKPAKVGVDIILFDLEDSGTPQQEPHEQGNEYSWCKGAQYWAQNMHVQGYTAMYGILLDMVGNSNPLFAYEETSLYYAPDILNKVWEEAELAGYGHIFVRKQVGGIIDDHLFINKITGIPMIDIIHKDFSTPTGFFPQWHTLADNESIIDATTLGIVGDVVLRTIYKEK